MNKLFFFSNSGFSAHLYEHVLEEIKNPDFCLWLPYNGGSACNNSIEDMAFEWDCPKLLNATKSLRDTFLEYHRQYHIVGEGKLLTKFFYNFSNFFSNFFK